MTNVETKIAVKNQFEQDLLDKLQALSLPSFIKAVRVRRQRAAFGAKAHHVRAVYFKGSGMIIDLNIGLTRFEQHMLGSQDIESNVQVESYVNKVLNYANSEKVEEFNNKMSK